LEGEREKRRDEIDGDDVSIAERETQVDPDRMRRRNDAVGITTVRRGSAYMTCTS
jgi:hypothetical protein